MERELTVKFEGPATEQVHLPVRSLLAIVDVLQQEIRKRCGRLHTIRTLCELEIVSFDAASSTAELRLQGPPDCERAWHADDPLQWAMAELDCRENLAPHWPGLLRGRLARCLDEGIDAVEIGMRGCAGRQRLTGADRAVRPFAPLKAEEKLANVDAEAFNEWVRSTR